METNAKPIVGDADVGLSSPDEKGALPNLYYSVRETRRLLGDISHASIYRLIAADRLDARKLGGKTLISGQSIAKLAAELPRVGAR